jgi:D-3-phosphoglycerate dehydrogenase
VSKYKVVATARSFARDDNDAIELLLQAGCEVLRSPHNRPHGAEDLIPLVADADALIAGNDKVDASVIAAAPRLRVISRYGVGYDNVDLAAATARGIVVTNTPGTNENSVADLVFGLMLAVARKIPEVSAQVKEGRWQRLPGTEVWGKTLGIIGFGKIGRGVALRARGFNMNVLVDDPFVDESIIKDYNASVAVRADVLKGSDFITLHAPYSDETRNMIGKEQLELMKPTAVLINTARGGLVNEPALAEALKNGIIAGAALDVLENEPPQDGDLVAMTNLLVTAHIGGYTREATRAMSMLAAQNAVAVLTGQRSQFTVNQDIFKS